MNETFARQFAAEVERLMVRSPDDASAARAELEMRLKKTATAIDRLLDRLEGEEVSDSLMDRLKMRETERDALRQELTESVNPRPVVMPTRIELEAIYRAQVECLETLLTSSDHMVAANALLRELLGEVRVWGDPEARDGMAIEIGARRPGSSNPLGGHERAPRGALICLRFRFRWLREPDLDYSEQLFWCRPRTEVPDTGGCGSLTPPKSAPRCRR